MKKQATEDVDNETEKKAARLQAEAEAEGGRRRGDGGGGGEEVPAVLPNAVYQIADRLQAVAVEDR